jgi:alpha-tubulin suppressor-like RCC1 family protein
MPKQQDMREPGKRLCLPLAWALGLAACGSLEPRRDAGADVRDVPADDGSAHADRGADLAAAADAAPLPTTLVSTTPEPWGANCPRGGVRIVTVLDLNGNRTNDAEDATLGEQFVCNLYPVSVRSGPQHSCALASNGSVWCWGADAVGQLGDYGEHPAYAPRPVGGVEIARALAVGGDFACVILPTSGVRCWGKNDRGQGGHGSDQPFTPPSCVTTSGDSLLGATGLALGGAHACAVLDDGHVRCWGANDGGQLGDGTTADHNEPVAVAGISGAIAVATGGRHTCVLLADTTVRCWGAADEGQLGNGATTAPGPVTVANTQGTAPLAGVAALAAGDAFTCALLQDATVLCWGANGDCQLGQPATAVRALLPVPAPVRDVQSLATGSQHACAVLSSGKAVCWGRNDFGQAGAPAGACRASPVELPLGHVLTVGAGRTHSCAVDEIGLLCWGDNGQGQLGIGVASSSRSTSEPQPVLWHLAL